MDGGRIKDADDDEVYRYSHLLRKETFHLEMDEPLVEELLAPPASMLFKFDATDQTSQVTMPLPKMIWLLGVRMRVQMTVF